MRYPLAYLDTFSGPVPCKVTAITFPGGITRLTIQLTATRGAYKRGEILDRHPYNVIPRNCLYRRRGSKHLRVRAYKWDCIDGRAVASSFAVTL